MTSSFRVSALPDVEARFMVVLQRRANYPLLIGAARALGAAGEHAVVWQVIVVAGGIIDRKRRREWLMSLVAIVGAHAAAVVTKRVVRRPRPRVAGLQLLVPTMSGLSFPSSHSASTTAAAMSLSRLLPFVGSAAADGHGHRQSGRRRALSERRARRSAHGLVGGPPRVVAEQPAVDVTNVNRRWA